MRKAVYHYFYPDGTVRKKPWHMSKHKWLLQTSTEERDITMIATLNAMVENWYNTLSNMFVVESEAPLDKPIFRCNDTESGGIALKRLLSVNPRVLSDAKERADLIDLFLSDRDIEGVLYQKPVLPFILDFAVSITTTLPFDFVCRLITMHYRLLEAYESPSPNVVKDPVIYGIISDWPTIHYECPYLWVLLLLRHHAPEGVLA